MKLYPWLFHLFLPIIPCDEITVCFLIDEATEAQRVTSLSNATRVRLCLLVHRRLPSSEHLLSCPILG
jgi:hypothetical protein